MPLLLDTAASGQTTLEHIERVNLFIIPLDNERHWYRYHHLFADLLRQRLGQSKTSQEIRQYHLYASEWLEKNGDKAEAFRHLIAARDFGGRPGWLKQSGRQCMKVFNRLSGWVG